MHRGFAYSGNTLKCALCGKPFVASGGGRWPCKGAHSDTSANRSITTTELEERVLAGRRGRLLIPEMIARFAAQLQSEFDN